MIGATTIFSVDVGTAKLEIGRGSIRNIVAICGIAGRFRIRTPNDDAAARGRCAHAVLGMSVNAKLAKKSPRNVQAKSDRFRAGCVAWKI
jgi:hypothetical protein